MAGGVGGGFERGAHSINQSVLSGIQLYQQQKRYDQLDARYNKMFDYKAEFERGDNGLGPSYLEEEQAEQAAATRPEIPSSVPTSAPGPLGIPQTTFPTGNRVQPMPAAEPAKAPAGAMGLIPSGARPRMSMGRNPTLSMRPMGLSRFGRR